jgi:hypothetical protein
VILRDGWIVVFSDRGKKTDDFFDILDLYFRNRNRNIFKRSLMILRNENNTVFIVNLKNGRRVTFNS